MNQSLLPDRYLTVGWNNALTLVFGVPTVAYAVIVLSTSTVSDRTAFLGMALIGAVY